MKSIPIIFIGTAEIGAPLLTALHSDDRFDIKLVVTQADRPAGRGMEMQASPIKAKAEELGLEVFQPDDINSDDSVSKLKEANADLFVVFAYGQILSPEVLSIPKIGPINVHASILPKYRGASPIQTALLHGDDETGVSVMKMEEKMDTGPVYSTVTLPIKPSDTAVTLHDKMAKLSAEKVPDVLSEIAAGNVNSTAQNDAEATYCPKIQKSDGQIDWSLEAKLILNHIRALAGWPGTYTFFNGKRLKIIEATLGSQTSHLPPGTVFEFGNEVLIATKTDSIKPLTLQIEGKRAIPLSEFIKGNPSFINSKLRSDS